MYLELVNGILSVLPSQVIRIVLYGSVARGTNGPDSDVDIAVFVHSRLDTEMEERLSEVVVDMNLKYDKVFSVIDIVEETYQKWRGVTPYYQIIEKEGVVLWQAA